MFLPRRVLLLVYLCAVCSEVSSIWVQNFYPRMRQNYFDDTYARDTNQTLIAGIDDIKPISAKNCQNKVLRGDPSLSNAIECARTCRLGEPPKTCYYHFAVEYYPVAGAACQNCTPGVTDMHCNGCQCVPGDGVERMAMLVNRMLPGPSIEVCLGDYVVIDVENKMKGTGLTIHWHGMFQNGTQYYDGVPFVTQCPITEGTTFRYQYYADNEGTHFWHAHSGLHKMDGVYGPMVVREPQQKDVHNGLFEFDLSSHVMLISDWMHEYSTQRLPGRYFSNRGQEPDSLLINGRGRYTDRKSGNTTKSALAEFIVEPNRRYRFRLINSFCTVCPAQLTIEGHDLMIIATDGVAVKPVKVNSINSMAGERYDFVINTANVSDTYWIQLRGIGPCTQREIHQLAVLRYVAATPMSSKQQPSYSPGLPVGILLNPVDAICHIPRPNAICVSNLESAIPVDEEVLKEDPDVKIYLPISFHVYDTDELFRPNTYDRFMVTSNAFHLTSLVDDISFHFPHVPILSQYEDLKGYHFCNSSSRPDHCKDDCTCTHKINIPSDAIVEMILVDEFQAPLISHPFHLHGYAPYIFGMGRSPDKKVERITLKHAIDLDNKNLLRRFIHRPPAKDTFPVPNNGYIIFRFRANNIGYWLFHCHFIYHHAVGMDVLMHVGDHKDLPPVPPKFPKCGNYLPPIRRPPSRVQPNHSEHHNTHPKNPTRPKEPKHPPKHPREPVYPPKHPKKPPTHPPKHPMPEKPQLPPNLRPMPPFKPIFPPMEPRPEEIIMPPMYPVYPSYPTYPLFPRYPLYPQSPLYPSEGLHPPSVTSFSESFVYPDLSEMSDID